MNMLEQNLKNLSIYNWVIVSLAMIYIVFGILKFLNLSPAHELAVQTFPLFENELLFRGLGAVELFLGIGILLRPVRAIAAMLMILHLLGIFVLSVLQPWIVTSPETILTFEGQYIFKDILLLTVLLFIIKQELLYNPSTVIATNDN